MKLVGALLFFVCRCYCLQGQQVHGSNPYAYKVAFRFNFSGILDPVDNNVSAGIEYSIHPQWSLTADAAWITHSSYTAWSKGLKGYIFRPAVRYYPSADHSSFIEASFFYKHMNAHVKDWLGKDCVNNVPAYEQYQEFTYGKRVAGFNLQAGFEVNLSKNKRFHLEGYAGAGLRLKRQVAVSEKNACYNSGAFFDNSSGTTILPSLPLGLRVVYCTRK